MSDKMREITITHSYKKHIVRLIVLLLIVGCAAMFFYNKSLTSSSTLTSYSMGTYVTQTVYGDEASQAITDANNDINHLDSLISWRNEESDIYNLNQNAGTSSTHIDDSTMDILSIALQIANISEGAFDPTILPYTSTWDFDSDKDIIPSSSQLDSYQGLVNYEHLILDTTDSTAYLDLQGEGIDLGAIGKGAACDEAIKTYKDDKIKSAVIAVGGSIATLGQKPNGDNWSIGIRDPYLALDGDTSSSMGIISIGQSFISTSGIYENYFIQDDKMYHHILDPNTGYPVDNNLMSVTIICQNGTVSDALSTACFILGQDNSDSLLDYYDADAIFIDKDKNVYVTDGLKDCFYITNGEYTLCN